LGEEEDEGRRKGWFDGEEEVWNFFRIFFFCLLSCSRRARADRKHSPIHMRIGAPRHQQAKIKKKPVFKAIPQQISTLPLKRW
jgi:hypothetical protein